MAQTLQACAAAGLKAVQLWGLYAWLHRIDFIVLSDASSPLPSAGTSDADPGQQSLQEWRKMAHSYAEAKSEEFVLSDGRKVGIAYYGAQSGPAVFHLHGFPGSRLSGVFFDEPGKKLGARIIALERPAIGISSPQPGRNVLDHANDIREIAEHLNLQSSGIIGVSGGGPYALACAYSLPEENLKSLSIVGGMGPIDMDTKGMNWSNWLIFKGLMHLPAIVRWLQRNTVAVL
jgi:hypothetical protein